jgi:trehalose/maltose transport system permease protein
MGIALVVNSQFRGRGALRAAMLVPWAVITVVNAQMWKLMFNDTYGVFNDILERIHWPGAPISFLSDPTTALAAVSAIDIWKTTPFVALLLLAGLQVIPNDVYEAATVDGASAWHQFWRITLPLLMPAILVTLIFRTMDALRVFDVFYVLFGAAPCVPGNCKTSMAVYNQQNIVTFAASPGAIGYGAAISVGIFVILAVVIAVYIKAIPLERS